MKIIFNNKLVDFIREAVHKRKIHKNEVIKDVYDLKTRTTRTIFDRQIGHSASTFPHFTQVT